MDGQTDNMKQYTTPPPPANFYPPPLLESLEYQEDWKAFSLAQG